MRLALLLLLPAAAAGFSALPLLNNRRVAISPSRCGVAPIRAAAAQEEAPGGPKVELPPHVKVKGEILTPYGVLLGASVFFTAFVCNFFCALTYLCAQLFDKKRRRGVDWVIHMWAKVSMSVCGYIPELIGKENLPKGSQNALYVPNHTSFMDILTLTGFVPRPMKYVSKAEILKIPFIGWPMKLAGHIALRTGSRRSQLETFKDTVKALQDGNSVITFPEGTRSRSGRLKPFKRGPFKMALQAGVPIVPVTIYDLARWYPAGTLLPITVPRGVKIIVHPQIVPQKGDSEADLAKRVYDIINESLPDFQQAPAGQDPVGA